jgi:hypothetical protein
MNSIPMVTVPQPAGVEPPPKPERRRETLRLRREEARQRMRILGLAHTEVRRRAQVAKGRVPRSLAGGPIQAGTVRTVAGSLAEAEPIPGSGGLIGLGNSDAPSTEAESPDYPDRRGAWVRRLLTGGAGCGDPHRAGGALAERAGSGAMSKRTPAPRLRSERDEVGRARGCHPMWARPWSPDEPHKEVCTDPSVVGSRRS